VAPPWWSFGPAAIPQRVSGSPSSPAFLAGTVSSVVEATCKVVEDLRYITEADRAARAASIVAATSLWLPSAGTVTIIQAPPGCA